jgi:hypothetical protein
VIDCKSTNEVELYGIRARPGWPQDSSWHVAIYNLKFTILNSRDGVLAQLVERLNGIEEVTGSNPVGSIFFFAHRRSVASVAILRYYSKATAPWVTNALLFPCIRRRELLRF